jgi:hypothetical protein
MIPALYRKREPLFLLLHAASLLVIIWFYLFWLALLIAKTALHVHLYPQFKYILSPIAAVVTTLLIFYVCTSPLAMWLACKHNFANSKAVAMLPLVFIGIFLLSAVAVLTTSIAPGGFTVLFALTLGVSTLCVYKKTIAAIREHHATIRTRDIVRLGCGTPHAIECNADSALEPRLSEKSD